ncbi:DegV family protein [Fructobacillus sp. M2-14]|uniref:DegV family protein n=1 Tax=Fructobacillus broussonetiae TaxID=2713173 RepID=A0ABS5QYH7_9LACO|nr:DegV family protein [Fructobacillus broussonetiae]MBS9338228.1 DegV family protein [Fructobacillus broussonetiae]
MTKVKIVTDSGAKFTKEELEKYDIKVVPLTVQIDDTIYQDGVTITPEEFLEKMEKSQNLPQTSQPSLGVFQETYEECLKEDPEADILSLHISSGLSGTVNAAQQAGALVKGNVTAFDTRQADQAQAFVVLAAAKAASEGKNIDEVLAAAERARKESHVYLSFRSLDNMVAGGRLSKTQGLIGNVLNIKVGAKVDEEGLVDVVVKGRGLKTIKAFNKSVIEEMKSKSKMLSIGVTHAGVPEEAETLAEELRAIWPDINIAVMVASPLISTHTGLGALAILFEAED